LPDNGIVDRATGFAVPHHCGFPLIGDADADDPAQAFAQYFPANRYRGAPDFFRIMLDPAIGRKYLRQWALGDRNLTRLGVKQDGAR